MSLKKYKMKKNIILPGLLIAVFIALFFSPFASILPDGLESAACKIGFIQKSDDSKNSKALFGGYLFPGIKNEKVSTAMAGFTGVIIVFAISAAFGYLLSNKKRKN